MTTVRFRLRFKTDSSTDRRSQNVGFVCVRCVRIYVLPNQFPSYGN